MPNTRVAILDGEGVVSGGTPQPQSAPKPYTGAPSTTPSAPAAVGIRVVPPAFKGIDYSAPVKEDVQPPAENRFGTGPKIPQPRIPDVSGIKGRAEIQTNPKRYTVSDERVVISAIGDGVGQSKDRIKPIVLTRGRRPELKPLLEADGIVVKVGEHYLVSPQTLADIQNSGNPHYDIVGNGKVLNTAMGLSVPVMEIDMRKVMESGRNMDVVNRFAGVKSVDYVYESETIMGVPEALLNQINHTLNPKRERPADRFAIWNISLTGDYSTKPATIVKPGTDGRFNKASLQSVVAASAGRMNGLRKDLNVIKDTYFGGGLKPEDTSGVTILAKVAKPVDPVEEAQRPNTTAYVKKTVTLTGHSAVPLSNGWSAQGATVTAAGSNTTVAGANTPAAIGAERDNLLNRWNGYNLTPSEKGELKSVRASGRVVKLDNGFEIPTGGVYFSPTLFDKLRIIPDGTFSSFMNSWNAGNRQQDLWDKFVSYFGYFGNLQIVQNVGVGYGVSFGTMEWINQENRRAMSISANRTVVDRYVDANNKRIGEVLYLTTRIKELEIAEGKTY